MIKNLVQSFSQSSSKAWWADQRKTTTFSKKEKETFKFKLSYQLFISTAT